MSNLLENYIMKYVKPEEDHLLHDEHGRAYWMSQENALQENWIKDHDTQTCPTCKY